MDSFGSIVQTLFYVRKYFVEFVSGFIVPEFLQVVSMYINYLDIRFDKHTYKSGAKPEDKVDFADLLSSKFLYAK